MNMVEAARIFVQLSELMRAADYLSEQEVACHFKIGIQEARFLLGRYYEENPDAAESERDRLSRKARGGWL